MKKRIASTDKIIKEKAVEAAKIAIDKKAKDTIILELSEVSGFADYFVICSGENQPQVKAIANAIDEFFSKKFKMEPLGVEGLQQGRWVLMDYGDIIVHIFNDEARSFYELEKLWIDAPRVSL